MLYSLDLSKDRACKDFDDIYFGMKSIKGVLWIDVTFDPLISHWTMPLGYNRTGIVLHFYTGKIVKKYNEESAEGSFIIQPFQQQQWLSQILRKNNLKIIIFMLRKYTEIM